MAKDDLTKAQKDQVKHYEDANYKQEDPKDITIGAGHNETIWFKNECKRLVKERDESQDALANALEVNESHRKLNGKLQERVTELEEENKKLHDALNKKMNNLRKSGL